MAQTGLFLSEVWECLDHCLVFLRSFHRLQSCKYSELHDLEHRYAARGADRLQKQAFQSESNSRWLMCCCQSQYQSVFHCCRLSLSEYCPCCLLQCLSHLDCSYSSKSILPSVSDHIVWIESSETRLPEFAANDCCLFHLHLHCASTLALFPHSAAVIKSLLGSLHQSEANPCQLQHQ